MGLQPARQKALSYYVHLYGRSQTQKKIPKGRTKMLYMVIEHFKHGAPEVYRRARDKGRMLPDGLEYVSSWVDLEFKTCYQLMRTDDASLFAVWTNAWRDLVEFEIVPVRTSAEAAQVIAPQL
jgi:hypothetical protein